MATTSIILGTELPSAISPTSKWQMDGSCRPLSVNFPERSVYFASLVIDYLGRNRGESLGEIARSHARSLALAEKDENYRQISMRDAMPE